MCKFISTEIRNSKFTENVINDGCAHFDGVISRDHSVWLKACKNESFHKFFKRNSVLQPQGNSNRKAIHQAPESSPLFVHINKNFSDCTIFILASTQVEFVSSDNCFLRVSFTAVRQSSTFGDVAVNYFFCNPDLFWFCGSDTFFNLIFIPQIFFNTHIKRLTEFRPIAIKRITL